MTADLQFRSSAMDLGFTCIGITELLHLPINDSFLELPCLFVAVLTTAVYLDSRHLLWLIILEYL